jgi:EAL domain-containing protein (putative c-di-GMP-specific phosphodiesterase class I)
MLRRHLEATGFPPRLLELEITESTVMHSSASTMRVLTDLQQMGVRLSIDDFGTGYSSLSRLQRLPVHALKIDQTFVQDIDKEGRGALTHGIIIMAHSLGLDVTAEGVETQHQLEFLEASGCDRMQGHLFSRALPADRMDEFLRTRQSLLSRSSVSR